MSDTTSRILRLLSLLQTHRDWSGSELAGRLEVSPRTIRRDIDRLRELGYPVYASAGVAGGYRLQAGASMPPLLLDDEEAVAIAVGLRFAAGGSVAGIDEASVRALAKVEQVLPSRLRRQVNALQTYTVPMTYAGNSGPTVDPDTLICIVQACRDLERLRFDYTAKDGADTKRLVEPHRLVSAGRRWYLVCWDVDRHDWRTFRVDRLSACETQGIHFHPRELPAEDAAAYVQSAIASTYTRYQLVVRLHAPLTELADKVRSSDAQLEEVDENTCILRATGDSLEWLAAWMGWFGVDFEILEPPELIDYVRNLAARMERSTGNGS
ncbi:MAG TPA: YafY family protein [Actinomycetota bacterium]|nr:YafY family protein [Actinomycetota bacterium]